MSNRPFRRLSSRCRMALMVAALIALSAELTVHSILAKDYYYLDIKNLQLVALAAVKAGAAYLPANPRAAVRIADAYMRSHGIAPAEIVFTKPSSDGDVLTIKLDRKIPLYLALLAVGLPTRDIRVTASARCRSETRPAPAESSI